MMAIPTRLTGGCGDCGSELTLRHDDGISGEGLAWPCPVCGNPLRLAGTHYIEVDR